MVLQIIASFLGFLLVGYGIWMLRQKFPVIDKHWKDGYIWIFLAIILIHMGIWWRWPNFWHDWRVQSGSMFFQFLLGVGLYLRLGLKDKKFLKHLGLMVTCLGIIGMYWNISTAFSVDNSATNLMMPTALNGIPRQNKEVEKEVTQFWKKHIPEESALAMLRIIRRQSGFNQFESDGKMPYRNPTFGSTRVGVMQIDDTLWLERAVELGYNIYTLEGNMRFGLWLYNEKGFEPWGYSNETISSRLKTFWDSLWSSDRPKEIRHGGPIMQYGSEENAFVFNPDVMPTCADKRVWDEAVVQLKDSYPDQFARTHRESCFNMYERDKNGKILEDQVLRAKLDGGGIGTAGGALQIKPDHVAFCHENGVDDIYTNIKNHFRCATLIYNDPTRGPEAWDPADGKPLFFPVPAGEEFSHPWKLSWKARFDIKWEGKIEEKIGLDGGETLTITVDSSGKVHDQSSPDPNSSMNWDLGNRVRTISYRSLEKRSVVGHVKLFYPVTLSAKR